MIYSIFLWLLITWVATQFIAEFSDGNFKKLLTKYWWRQKLTCTKCLSFWITLIGTQSFVIAATVSIINHILSNTIEGGNNEINL